MTKATRKLQEADSAAEHAKGWKPRRFGVFFCSPRCGAHCTHEAYLQATAKAEKLAARLNKLTPHKGRAVKPWAASVWENMGWHYQAINGVCSVSEEKDRRKRRMHYTVYFNTATQFCVSGTSLEDAMRLARTSAEAHVRKINRDLKDMP